MGAGVHDTLGKGPEMSCVPRFCLSSALALAALAALACRSLPLAAPAQCLRVRHGLIGLRASSTAWSLDGGTLLVADLSESRLLRFSAEGTRLEDITSPEPGPLHFDHPISLAATPSGFLLGEHGYRWLRLGPEGRPVAQAAYAMPGSVQLFDTVYFGGQLIGRGTAPGPDNERRVGLLRFDLDRLQATAWEERAEESGHPAGREQLISPFLAVAEGRLYALRAGATSKIERPFQGETLAAFPPGFGNPPELESSPVDAVAKLEAELAEGAWPAALLAQDRFLFVLTRRPRPTGGTLWQLHRINSRLDRLEGSWEVPSAASHLLVAPGPRHWALLEQGPLEVRPERGLLPGRDLPSLLLVPSAWLGGTEFPPAERALEPRCPPGF